MFEPNFDYMRESQVLPVDGQLVSQGDLLSPAYLYTLEVL